MSNAVYNTIDTGLKTQSLGTGLKTQSLGTDKVGQAPPVIDVSPVLRRAKLGSVEQSSILPPRAGLEFSVNGMSNEETILLQPDDDNIIRHKISDGCYWALVISIISVIIVSTLWCIIKYYHAHSITVDTLL